MTKPQILNRLLSLGVKLAYATNDITPDATEFLKLHEAYIAPRIIVSRYLGKMDAADPRLSKRESVAVTLFNRSMSGKDIAAKMGLSTGTVKCHLSSARKKLGVKYVSTEK